MNHVMHILMVPALWLAMANAVNNNGFEKFKFGTPKETYRNLTLEMEEGNSSLYTANPDEIKKTGVQIESVRLTFTKNKLSAIALSTKNATGLSCFRFLKEHYGEPVNQKNHYCWNKTDMTVVFELSKNKKDAYIDFYGK